MTGSLRGPQMGSFVENDGRPIGCGQFFIALNPKMFSGGMFDEQVKALDQIRDGAARRAHAQQPA